MAFMQKQIEHGLWLEVDTSFGIEVIPADMVGHTGWMKVGGTYECDCVEEDSNLKSLLDDLGHHHFDDVLTVQLVEGWGARMSAPGYLDCTEWTVFATEDEANEHLDDVFGEDEGGA